METKSRCPNRLSVRVWNVDGSFGSPKRKTRYSKCPKGVPKDFFGKSAL
jgi:hypothetical protein